MKRKYYNVFFKKIHQINSEIDPVLRNTVIMIIVILLLRFVVF